MKKNTLQTLNRFLLKGMYIFCRALRVDSRTMSILCYHSISSDHGRYSIPLSDFHNHIKILQNNGRFISIDDALYSGSHTAHPRYVLTFDDGYKDVLQVLPFTKKYGIPVALFVMSDSKNVNRKELDHSGRLLSAEDIRKLYKEGWTIGCHSATHADFSTLSEKELYREIAAAKTMLEKQLGAPVRYFAYPKGVYSERVMQAVKKAGYKAAFAAFPGVIGRKTDMFAYPRIVIDKSYLPNDLPGRVSFLTVAIREYIESAAVKLAPISI